MERARAELDRLAGLILRGTTAEEAVTLAWPLVCGKRIAQSTRALRLEGQELVVEVPDRAWRTELASYLPHYLHQLKKTTGVEVETVRFVVGHEKSR